MTAPSPTDEPALFAPPRRRKVKAAAAAAEADATAARPAAARGGPASTSKELASPRPAHTHASFKALGVSDWLCR